MPCRGRAQAQPRTRSKPGSTADTQRTPRKTFEVFSAFAFCVHLRPLDLQPPTFPQAQYVRSSVRYCIASAICLGCNSAVPSRSAIVRATFKIRSWARALRPCWSWRVPADVRNRPRACKTSEYSVTTFARCSRAFLSGSKNGPVESAAPAPHAQEFSPSFPARSCCASPCNSPPARRCECRCGRAAGPEIFDI